MLIRKYQQSDREAIRTICKDTAFEKYRHDEKRREMVCMMFIDYFLDYEPQNCIVVENEGVPVGYIVCSTDAELYNEKVKKVYNKKLRKMSFWVYLFNKFCLRVSNKLNKKYNGGFHINVNKDNQGKKLGPKLLTALGVHLHKNGFKYMYLVTANKKTKGYSFYKHFGFEVVKKYLTGSIALTYDTENALKRFENLQNDECRFQI